MNQQAENTEKNFLVSSSLTPRGRGNSSVTPKPNEYFLEVPFPGGILGRCLPLYIFICVVLYCNYDNSITKNFKIQLHRVLKTDASESCLYTSINLAVHLHYPLLQLITGIITLTWYILRSASLDTTQSAPMQNVLLIFSRHFMK